MRLASFLQDDEVHTGVLAGDEIIDLAHAGTSLPRSMAQAIACEDRAPLADWVANAPKAARVAAKEIEFAVPATRPAKIVCLGLNYADHAAEGGHQLPTYPALFMRSPTSLVAAGRPIVRPACSERLDFEAELMVVIGRGGRHIPEDRALEAVFGYTLFNDGSVRDYQRKSTQWTAGKNFDATGAIGPFVVTADELPAGAHGLAIRCVLDGQVMQQSNTSRMIFDVPRTIAILSEIMTLEPGDLIAMGTPDGVGNARKPPVYMQPGNVVSVEVEGIGRLDNPIAAESNAGRVIATGAV